MCWCCSTPCKKIVPCPWLFPYFAWIRLSRPGRGNPILFIILRLFPVVSESHRQGRLKESLIKPAPKGRSWKAGADSFFFEWLFWQCNLHSVINCLSCSPLHPHPHPHFTVLAPPFPLQRLVHDSSKSVN